MHFELGKWLVICDRCGFKRMSDEVIKTWDNLIVCKPTIKTGCYETRHPQDFVRAVKEDPSVPYTRSQPADVFTDVEINCSALEVRWHPSVIYDNTYIGKGISRGPVTIEDGAEVIVLCEWTII